MDERERGLERAVAEAHCSDRGLAQGLAAVRARRLCFRGHDYRPHGIGQTAHSIKCVACGDALKLFGPYMSAFDTFIGAAGRGLVEAGHDPQWVFNQTHVRDRDAAEAAEA